MSSQSFAEVLINSQADGGPVTNTTPASLLPAAAKFTLPGNFFAYVGKALRVTATGRVSNIVTTPGTLTLDIRFGGTVVFNGGAMTLNTTAKTNVSWWLDVLLTCRTIGSAAVLLGQGIWTAESVVGSTAGAASSSSMPASAPAVGTSFDGTATQAVDFFATWSINNAGNTITSHQFVLESIN